MKILYYSDRYAFNVMGTKRSLAEGLARRRHEVITLPTDAAGNIVDAVAAHGPNVVFLAHSGLVLPRAVKAKLKVPVVGFGFSDPYYFTPKRLASYDAYVTYHFGTWREHHQKRLPMLYCQTACDLRFHRKLSRPKTIDISMSGVGRHPRFRNPRLRIQTVNRLRRETTFNIAVYGRGWDPHPLNRPHIEGGRFLEVINRTRLGLDVEEGWSPLAHRMMEYAACGTPVITRDREEVAFVFEPGKEVLVYTSYNNLKEQVLHYLKEAPAELEAIATAAKARCERDHDIDKRVGHILGFLEEALGIT